MEVSSNNQNSFARRKAKFNTNVLVKLSSPSEMMKKAKEEESRFAKEKAPKSGSRSQNGIEQQARCSRKEIKIKSISRGKTQKKTKKNKGEHLWNDGTRHLAHHKRKACARTHAHACDLQITFRKMSLSSKC